jgi:hypothetical protein
MSALYYGCCDRLCIDRDEVRLRRRLLRRLYRWRTGRCSRLKGSPVTENCIRLYSQHYNAYLAIGKNGRVALWLPWFYLGSG